MLSWPWPRMPNCLLLCNGRCALFCGCRPPCEEGLSSASSSPHRCMVGPRISRSAWSDLLGVPVSFCGTRRLTRTTPWINAWYLLYQRCVDEVNRSWFQASKHPGPQPQQKDHLCPCPGGVPKELVAHWLLRNVVSHSSLELLKVVKLCMSTLVVSRSPPRFRLLQRSRGL